MADAGRAFVSGFQHDVFVSYACVDDIPDDEDQPGWVRYLVQRLENRLAQLLGRRDSISIWQDVELAKHVDITAQITETIQRSAILLVVLSPGYMASDWCRREREWFLKWVHDRLESGSRVFLIERDRVEGSRPEEFGKPHEFQGLLGHKFWVEAGGHSRPVSRDYERERFEETLNDLAHGIAGELKRLRDAGATPDGKPIPTPEPAAAAVKIYLAEVTDDLRSSRRKVQKHLEQFGVKCISPETSRMFEEDAVGEALDQVHVFVQLLSPIAGRPVLNSTESFVACQHRLALELGKEILQWRDPSLTEASWKEAHEEDEEVDVRAHRQLVFGKTVQAVHLEDFAQYVKERANRLRSETADSRGDPGGLIFVNFNRATQDRAFAEELCGYLDQKGFGVIEPPDVNDAPPEMIREEFETNVRDCQGLIVLYGDQTAKMWTRRQLSETYKLFCEQRKPLHQLALCACPPPNKNVENPAGYKPPRLTVIDCQAGFEFDKLTPFLEALRDNVTPAPQESEVTV